MFLLQSKGNKSCNQLKRGPTIKKTKPTTNKQTKKQLHKVPPRSQQQLQLLLLLLPLLLLPEWGPKNKWVAVPSPSLWLLGCCAASPVGKDFSPHRLAWQLHTSACAAAKLLNWQWREPIGQLLLWYRRYWIDWFKGDLLSQCFQWFSILGGYVGINAINEIAGCKKKNAWLSLTLQILTSYWHSHKILSYDKGYMTLVSMSNVLLRVRSGE